MATPKKAPRIVVTAEWLLIEPEGATHPYADELASAAEAESATLCAACGDLLAWHEQACPPVSGPALGAEAAAQEPVGQPRLAAPAFAYELGHRVQPTPTSTAQVIWRGQLKERHPANGLVHRVNVYRLNDGYWDCYREEELQAP